MLQSDKKGIKNHIGALGEDIAADFLKKRGFSIHERNYLKPWGEIDIIAKNMDIIHFVEVKTVSYETKIALEKAVSYETWRPEEQLHEAKRKKLQRTIETWLLEQKWEGDWQLDLVAVRLVEAEKYATTNYIENIT